MLGRVEASLTNSNKNNACFYMASRVSDLFHILALCKTHLFVTVRKHTLIRFHNRERACNGFSLLLLSLLSSSVALSDISFRGLAFNFVFVLPLKTRVTSLEINWFS